MGWVGTVRFYTCWLLLLACMDNAGGGSEMCAPDLLGSRPQSPGITLLTTPPGYLTSHPPAVRTMLVYTG